MKKLTGIAIATTLALAFTTPAFAAEDRGDTLAGYNNFWGQPSPYVQIDNGVSYCSGTLVDATHVLTAAHCYLGQNYTQNIVRKTTDQAFIQGVSPVTGHSDVARVDVYPNNDIALLTLNRAYPGPYMAISEKTDWSDAAGMTFTACGLRVRDDMSVFGMGCINRVATNPTTFLKFTASGRPFFISTADSYNGVKSNGDGMLRPGDSGGGVSMNGKLVGVNSTPP